MHSRSWRAYLQLPVAIVLYLTSVALCQTVALIPVAFSELVENAEGSVQLKASANLSSATATVRDKLTVNGAFGVWMFLPSDVGIVRLEKGSELQLSNLGISFVASRAPNFTALMTLPFFDVDLAATLALHNVSVNLDCATLSTLQKDVCDRMPDTNYEVALWSLRVVSLTTSNLVAENVTLRCGPSATNSTVTTTYMGSDVGATSPIIPVPTDFSCVSRRVFDYGDFRAILADFSNARPRAIYIMVMANVTGLDSLSNFKLLNSKYRVDIVISGSPGVRTQLDLRGAQSIISLLGAGNDLSNPTTVEIRDITLVNLGYGPNSQYPLSLVTAALWFLEYSRTDYTLMFNESPVRLDLTRVHVVVSAVELRWWRNLVLSAISSGATGIDPDALIANFTTGIQVATDNGSIWVPYWEWKYGWTTWTNCTLTATALAVVPPVAFPTRPDLLDTLSAYGQVGPVPLSAVQLGRQELDSSQVSLASNVVLPVHTQLASDLAGSPTVLGANLTIWGDARIVRYLSLRALSGAVTVPPYTVLTLRFMTIINTNVGGRNADPSPLQNYTFMMWAFNRTLLPASAPVRRAALSAATAPGSDTLAQGTVVRQRLLAERWQRRRLTQTSSAGDSGSPGSDISGVSTSGDKIPAGPFRPWLRLEDVTLILPALEVQLLYDVLNNNRTSLRVAPAVVDWLSGMLATAQATVAVISQAPNVTSYRISFASLRWLGIEALNLVIQGSTPVIPPFPLLQPSASILLPDPLPTPTPPPPEVLLALPPSSTSPQQRPLDTGPAPESRPPLAPPTAVDPTAVAAAAPSAENPIGSIVGPAVGSVAGLLLVCGLVTFVVVYVRNRRKRAQAADASKASGQDNGGEGMNGADVKVPASNCPGEAGNGQPPPPSSPPKSQARSTPGAAAAAAETACGGGGADLDAIQAVTDDDAKPRAGAAAASGGQGAGLPPLALNRHRSRGANGGGGAGRKPAAQKPGTRDDGGGVKSGPGGASQQRKSRPSGSAASVDSGSKSAAGSSGTASDAASINPRTELYATLAAFQSELGEQQQQITILSQLGAGAHGVVYKGEWRGLEVAVKTLLFQAIMGADSEDCGNSLKEQAILEAAIATTLYHPNVINTFSYDIKPLRMCPVPSSSSSSTRANTVVSSEGGGIIDWKLYIIQEYCDGGTLKDALDDMRFTDPDTGTVFRDTVVRVAIEIASGMSYIHARNIIHGDLKPANILLRSNTVSPFGYTVKIADFGLALKLKAGESHISNIRRGTPFYIAAELVEDGRATTASDLYSFGVILWELLHGSTVARRMPLRRRIPNLPAEFYTWPTDCPPAYRELATACLSSSPSARPRFPDALATLTKLLASLVEVRRQQQQQRRQQQHQEERRHWAVDAIKSEPAGHGQDQGQGVGIGANHGGEGLAAAANGGAGEGQTAHSSDYFYAPPVLLENALRKLEGGPPTVPLGRKPHSGGGGGGGGSSNGGGHSSSTRQTGSGGGADPALLEGGSGGAGPGRRSEVTGASAATTADHGHPGICASEAVVGRAASSAACGKHVLEPTPEDAVLQPRSGPGVDAVPGTAKAANSHDHDSQPCVAAEVTGATAAGTAAAGWSGPAQCQGYDPFGGVRPRSLRALACTASAAAQAAAAPSGTLAGMPLGVDARALSCRSAVGVQPQQPQHHHLRSPAPSPSGLDPCRGATAPLIREPAGTLAGAASPIAVGAAISSSAATASSHRHAPRLDAQDAHIGSARAAILTKPPCMPAAAAASGGAPHSPAAMTAAAAAALAALAANSVTNTRTLDPDTAGLLDSCLFSTDARAMDRGLMLDLMPALSNHAHSSRVSSALSPELAAALENMLGVHGIRRDAAPELKSVESGSAPGST